MDSIVSLLLGAVCIVIGIANRRGNLSMLHSYHRHRVSEEDRLPFGKLVGLGTMVIGVALILMGILSFMASTLGNVALLTVGNVVLIVGLVAGFGLSFYAMIRYNKGIF